MAYDPYDRGDNPWRMDIDRSRHAALAARQRGQVPGAAAAAPLRSGRQNRSRLRHTAAAGRDAEKEERARDHGADRGGSLRAL